MQKLRCGHLFNGIGGFQLAAHWMGWANVFHCDINEFCNRVVAKHFPQSISYGDIKTINFKIHRGEIDLITGGFPCQPVSKAGKRRGSEDARWLWPEYARAITEIQPTWIVIENVPNLVNVGIVQVFDDLEREDYMYQPFLLPASAVGAGHNRLRLWIVGFKAITYDTNPNGFGPHRAETDGCGGQQRGNELRDEQVCLPGSLVSAGVRTGSDSRIFGVDNGISDRVDRLKSIGNAIVPQMALVIFKMIDQWNKKNY